MAIIHFDQIDSTNEYLKKNYLNYPHNTVITTSHQTAGRGRNERIWHDEADQNIMLSVLIKLPLLFDPLITLKVATITWNFISNYLPKESQDNLKIKWPNDLLYNNEKLVGILTEGISYGDKIGCLVIGIGINLNQINFPNIQATSLKKITNKDFQLDLFRNDYIDYLLMNLNEQTPFMNVYRNHLYQKNCYVTFSKVIDGEEKEALLLNVDDDGYLILRIDGNEYRYTSGEIKIKI